MKISICESSIQMVSRAKRPDEIPQERVEIEKKKNVLSAEVLQDFQVRRKRMSHQKMLLKRC